MSTLIINVRKKRFDPTSLFDENQNNKQITLLWPGDQTPLSPSYSLQQIFTRAGARTHQAQNQTSILPLQTTGHCNFIETQLRLYCNYDNLLFILYIGICCSAKIQLQ